MAAPRSVFVTGGTGYLGSRLIIALAERGHTVRALVRPGSAPRLPGRAAPIIGDALDSRTYASQVAGADTFVHLVGVSHPGPPKAAQFRTVDLASAREAVQAAVAGRIGHFVYVSVAHPAPIMKAYWNARVEAEALIGTAQLNATILRPWYVLGPGHRWPNVLKPFYWIGERLPSTREGARRLGLVTVNQMIAALVAAVERPARGIRVLGVPDIRRGSGV